MNKTERLAKQLHTRAWAKFSKGYLRTHFACVQCGAPATETDHIRSRRLGGAMFSYANLQAMCKPCHSKKTRREGFQIDPKTGLRL